RLACRRRRSPCPTLFPYTTLFRSAQLVLGGNARGQLHQLMVQERNARLQPPCHGHVVDTLDRVVDQHHRGVQAQRLVHRQRGARSEEHTSELQSRENLVCRLLLEK